MVSTQDVQSRIMRSFSTYKKKNANKNRKKLQPISKVSALSRTGSYLNQTPTRKFTRG